MARRTLANKGPVSPERGRRPGPGGLRNGGPRRPPPRRAAAPTASRVPVIRAVWAEVPVVASVRRGASGQRAGAYGCGSQWSTFVAPAGADRSTRTVAVPLPSTYVSSFCSSTRPEPASRKSTVTVK